MKEIDNAIAANRGAKCSHADLPKVKFDQPVIFNGDGVVVEGHVVSASDDGQNFSLASDDGDVWIIKTSDVVESAKMDAPISGVPGTPVRLKIRVGAEIALDRRMIVGVHVIGTSAMQVASVSDAKLNPPSGCQCPRQCNNGWCCAQGGWIYVCSRNSCVFSQARC
ncbi:hypothetical protein [Limnobacter profundi]|nr:hypothetical protein [Limnobacter sp. SAORIC-580]